MFLEIKMSLPFQVNSLGTLVGLRAASKSTWPLLLQGLRKGGTAGHRVNSSLTEVANLANF